MPSLSVIVPCYNDEGSIGPFLRELASQAGFFSRFEIIVVDDASRDGSPSIIRSLAAELPLRVVTHPRSLGLGAAVRTGFNAATLEWVTYLPGDVQVPAEEVGASRRPLGRDFPGWKHAHADLDGLRGGLCRARLLVPIEVVVEVLGADERARRPAAHREVALAVARRPVGEAQAGSLPTRR